MNNIAKSIKQQVITALHEDIGSEDITARLIPADTQLTVHLICREQAILCGVDWFNLSFSHLNSHLKIEWFATDGDTLQPDQTVCKISGNARSILTAERTALNFLQTLSATATATNNYHRLIKDTSYERLYEINEILEELPKISSHYLGTHGTEPQF